MKKLITLLISLLLLLSVMPTTALADDEYFTQEQIDYYKNLGLQGTTVNVYNWGEYISDGSEGSMDVVYQFERLTGAKVNYTNFESNENMYSKLSGGGVSYDVIVPSDYMIDRLIDEDMLLELDFDKKFEALLQSIKETIACGEEKEKEITSAKKLLKDIYSIKEKIKNILSIQSI